MLMDNTTGLDGFYSDLRRKYPNAFNAAPDLGKVGRGVQKLPLLEKTAPTSSSLGNLSPSPNNPQKWTPDGFLYKIQMQKSQGLQRQVAELSQNAAGSVIIQGKAVTVPALSKRDAQKRLSFHLPSLRTQVEQNHEELKNRLNIPKESVEEKMSTDRQSINATETRTSSESVPTRESAQRYKKPSGVKPDALGTIMKELLPSKPGRLMHEPTRSSREAAHRNGACPSDSDSGISVCVPIKVFRAKSRSPHGPPASSDIIKKFSVKPKPAHGPLKADHTVIADIRSQAINVEEKTVDAIFTKSCSTNEKKQERSRTPHVRFEDESEHEAESRYQDRCFLGTKDTKRLEPNNLESRSVQSLESQVSTKSSSPSSTDHLSTPSQQSVNIPYRRQPFPPSVAKKVLIDIPRSGLPNRSLVYRDIDPAGKSMANKIISPRYRKEMSSSSLDGINVNVSSDGWKGQDQIVSPRNIQDVVHEEIPQIRSIEKKFKEVSSQVTVMRMEWGGSESSVSSQTSESSSNHNLKSEPQPSGRQVSKNLQKGAEMSFYSKMKKSLHAKMKLSSDPRTVSAISQSEAPNPKEIQSREMITDPPLHHYQRGQGQEIGVSMAMQCPTQSASTRAPWKPERSPNMRSPPPKTMNLKLTNIEKENPDKAVPQKTPFLPMKMMKTFLKKGREKNYLVHVPSPPPSLPPPQEIRQPLQRALGSATKTIKPNLGHAQFSSQEPTRLVCVQSDCSKVIELQRPRAGFQGLYLARRSQDPHSELDETKKRLSVFSKVIKHWDIEIDFN